MAAAAAEIGSKVKATARAAEEAGVIKKRAQTAEMTIEPRTVLTLMEAAIQALVAVKAGVTTEAKPKPTKVPTKETTIGTKTMSSGVLPDSHFPKRAASRAAPTAETGCPVEKTALPTTSG